MILARFVFAAAMLTPGCVAAAPQVWRDAEGDILNTGTGTGKPAKDLSINLVPAPFPQYVPAVINMKPAEKEYWRVLKASAITYLDLQVLIGGKPQMVGVVALGRVPLHEARNNPRDVVWRTHLSVPPAERVESIVHGPPLGTKASLVTRTVDTGPTGENDPTRLLATIIATADATTRSRLSLSCQLRPNRSRVRELKWRLSARLRSGKTLTGSEIFQLSTSVFTEAK